MAMNPDIGLPALNAMRMGYLAYLIETAIFLSKNRTARNVWTVAPNRKGLRRRFRHWSARAFSPEKSPSLLTTKAIIIKRMITLWNLVSSP
jgi:hypothetical protein